MFLFVKCLNVQLISTRGAGHENIHCVSKGKHDETRH